MTMNGVKILKSVTLSLSAGRFCAFSKTVLQMVLVTKLENMV